MYSVIKYTKEKQVPPLVTDATNWHHTAWIQNAYCKWRYTGGFVSCQGYFSENCHANWTQNTHLKECGILSRYKPLTPVDSPMCTCKGGEQTSEHLIYHCNILKTQREIMKHKIKKSGGTWPTTNKELIAKHLSAFTNFISSIDFDKLN